MHYEIHGEVESFYLTISIGRLLAILATICARTLIIQGDRDFLYPIDISIEMYQAIPHCSLAIIPNGSHVPIFDEETDYFIKLTTKFLR